MEKSPYLLHSGKSKWRKRTAWSRGSIRMLTFRKGMDKLAWCRSIAFFKFPVEVGKAAETGSHGGICNGKLLLF